MKKVLSVTLFVFAALITLSQQPVQWGFSAKKIADKTYELHLTATIEGQWHIYSQFTPEGGPVPTKITFNKNALVMINGNTKEAGRLEQKHEESFGVDVKYFAGKVDFVQLVKLKVNVKTNLSGSIEYMVCNDLQCLPPKIIPFNISLK